MTIIALLIHVAAGLVGLGSGLVAAFARKGGRLHRRAGALFVFAMTMMAVFAAYLAVAVPDQLVNVFISGLTAYMVGTGWLTVRRDSGAIGLAERFALVFAVVIAAPFVILSVQLTAGLPPLFRSAVAFEGPVLVAIYAFTGVLVIAAAGDVKVVLDRGIAGAPRIARHLWRMCFGLALAAGSAFTNGFARLLPGPYHVPPIFFVPQLLPILLLIGWMIRLRLTGWFAREATVSREGRLVPQRGLRRRVLGWRRRP